MTAFIWVSDSFRPDIILRYAKDRSNVILKFTANSDLSINLHTFVSLKWRCVGRVSLEQNKIFLAAEYNSLFQ